MAIRISALARRTPRAALTLLLAGSLFAVPTAHAQSQGGAASQAQGGDSGMSQQKKQELRQAQKKVRELRQQIGQIQQKAMNNNPDLQKQQEDLKGLVKDKMKAKGQNPDQDISRMKEIRQKLQNNKDMPKDERQKLMQEFQKTTQSFQQAQKSVMQDPEVQEARSQFRDDLMAAMKEENPKVEQMIKDMEQARKEFQQLMQKQFSGKMGGGRAGAPAGQGAASE